MTSPADQPQSLTERRIERLEFDASGPTRQIHWDPELSGFGVRIYPSGTKSYVLSYGARHNRKLMVLGRTGVLPLAEARERARRHKVEILDGADPLAERQAHQERNAQAKTVEEMAEAFLDYHETRWSASHHKESTRRITSRVVPAFGALRPEEVTRVHVNRLHTKITDEGSPVEANRVRTLIHTLFEWAVEFGHTPEDHPNPAHTRRGSRIGRNRETSRNRYLTREEAPRLLAAADATGDPKDGVLVRLWLLTGLRKSELLHRRWSDVDLESAVLTVPVTKSRRIHRVPLTSRAIELLEGLPRGLEPDAPIFPGRDPGEPLSDFKRPWETIRELSGLRDLRIHDLRRTVATWLTNLAKVPLATVSAVLNQKPRGAGVTAIYARPMQESVREALEAMEALLANVEPTEEDRHALTA